MVNNGRLGAIFGHFKSKLTSRGDHENERSFSFSAVHHFMRTANLKHQIDRRSTILDAAEQCFSRAGFHQTSMNDICQAAGMSPGNLYRYFPSKEAIIAGITERFRLQTAADFDAVENAPSFYEGLAAMAQVCMVERGGSELDLCMEIMAECRRNPAIAKLFRDLEDDVKARLVKLLRSAAERGEINPKADYESAATMLMVMADGLSMRQVADPDFKVERLLPLVFKMVEDLLGKPALQNELSRRVKS
ncbi:TetR/AcrR family transcriptional regulator [Bradyrhizobium sp. LHD-71]|uniref:TetR/AcrR family transcriptional regulator n=1 Tax=Bradyrhizobium sp. LHD-71 TaxID=3072141 RepID=UPI00280F7F13|nr:TetR/AcrR family transcriptional regulator [Bradyrhizobium sp. LHD-71]MDQ8727063.1 TetR/AcrR family transcriptional regulator [Bradyrhizobium sp. LHD-71]